MGYGGSTKPNITLSKGEEMFDSHTGKPGFMLIITALISIVPTVAYNAKAYNAEQPVAATDEQHALIEDGTKLISPVSGESVTKGRRTPSLAYKNKLYFFCCQYHMRKFCADPEKYANNVTAPNGMDVSYFPGVNPAWGPNIEQPHIATNDQHALVDNGTAMISPVSGDSIVKSSRTPSVVYKGKLYFFCCQPHLRKFAANPEKYINSVIAPNGVDIKGIIEQNLRKVRSLTQVFVPTNKQHAQVANGTEMISPVSSESVTKGSKTPAAVYKGRLYFFCCQAHMRKFRADPKKYVKDVIAPNGTDVSSLIERNVGTFRNTGQLLVTTDQQHALVEDGTRMVSPISGYHITKGAKTSSAVYKGGVYYFCCHADMRKFGANPEKYIDEVVLPNGADISSAPKKAPPKKKKQPDTTIYDIDIGTSPVRGPADAPITIVEFTDFQCPFCIREWPRIKKILDQYPDKVRLVFKHFPLSFHEKAKAVHAAAKFAGQTAGTEAFWKMHDIIIDNPKKLAPSDLRRYAESLRLNLTEFDELMADETKMDELLKNDIAQARRCNVRGTPTVFINGRRLAKRSAETYKARIDQILKDAGKEK